MLTLGEADEEHFPHLDGRDGHEVELPQVISKLDHKCCLLHHFAFLASHHDYVKLGWIGD